MESKENNMECCCECCHCKKVFMLLVLIILAFIAGIMTGSCQSGYNHMPNYAPQFIPIQAHHIKAKKFHRGATQTTPQQNNATNTEPLPQGQISGIILEVDQGN